MVTLLLAPAAEATTSADKKTAKSATAPVHASARNVKRTRTAHIEAAHPSFGQLAGLHGTPDDLQLKSSVALVLDQDTNEILLNKNSEAVLPIASLTKLMTVVVVTEAQLP